MPPAKPTLPGANHPLRILRRSPKIPGLS